MQIPKSYISSSRIHVLLAIQFCAQLFWLTRQTKKKKKTKITEKHEQKLCKKLNYILYFFGCICQKQTKTSKTWKTEKVYGI